MDPSFAFYYRAHARFRDYRIVVKSRLTVPSGCAVSLRNAYAQRWIRYSRTFRMFVLLLVQRKDRTATPKAIIWSAKYNSAHPYLSYSRGAHNARLYCNISTKDRIQLAYRVLPSKIEVSFPFDSRVFEMAIISAWSVAYRSHVERLLATFPVWFV